MKRIAIIRLRGMTGIKRDIKDTMNMLRLYNKNHCVIISNSENYIGMLRKVKDYVTWGEIDSDTLKLLDEKRGKKDSRFYRLNSPRKGFERKGIKRPFSVGGVLGYRGSMINDLVKRMV